MRKMHKSEDLEAMEVAANMHNGITHVWWQTIRTEKI